MNIYTNIDVALYKNRYGKWSAAVRWQNQRRDLKIGADTPEGALGIVAQRIANLRKVGKALEDL